VAIRLNHAQLARGSAEGRIVADPGEGLIAGVLGVGVDVEKIDQVAAGHAGPFEIGDGIMGGARDAAVLDIEIDEGIVAAATA